MGVNGVGGSGSEHPAVFACESVSQPWLLVMPGETEPWFQFWGYSMMPGVEPQGEGSYANVTVLFAGCGGLHTALGT